jgi:hypothetical protein
MGKYTLNRSYIEARCSFKHGKPQEKDTMVGASSGFYLLFDGNDQN